MIQHCDPFKNFFIYSATKSENKQITTQPKLVLNLKKRLLYFSKQTNNENTYLKKNLLVLYSTKTFFIKDVII